MAESDIEGEYQLYDVTTRLLDGLRARNKPRIR